MMLLMSSIRRVRASSAARIVCIALASLLFSCAGNRDMKRVALYFPDAGTMENERIYIPLSGYINMAIVDSDRYIAVDRSRDFLAAIAQEHEFQRSGAVDARQISELGRQWGVEYVVVVSVRPTASRDTFLINARMIEVEGASIYKTANATSPLKSDRDVRIAANDIIRRLGLRIPKHKRADWDVAPEQTSATSAPTRERSSKNRRAGEPALPPAPITRVIKVDMFDRECNGWEWQDVWNRRNFFGGSLSITVNGTVVANDIKIEYGRKCNESYSFTATVGDTVSFRWVRAGSSSRHDDENAFVVYYEDAPPVPEFNPSRTNTSDNILIQRTYNTLRNVTSGWALGSFVVTAPPAPEPPATQRNGRR